jgi:hypothetical protein
MATYLSPKGSPTGDASSGLYFSRSIDPNRKRPSKKQQRGTNMKRWQQIEKVSNLADEKKNVC